MRRILMMSVAVCGGFPNLFITTDAPVLFNSWLSNQLLFFIPNINCKLSKVVFSVPLFYVVYKLCVQRVLINILFSILLISKKINYLVI